MSETKTTKIGEITVAVVPQEVVDRDIADGNAIVVCMRKNKQKYFDPMVKSLDGPCSSCGEIVNFEVHHEKAIHLCMECVLEIAPGALFQARVTDRQVQLIDDYRQLFADGGKGEA